MNARDAQLWLETVFGSEPDGWVNLRAIDPDQVRPPQSTTVRSIDEALRWCNDRDGQGWNLYAGLALRGDARDDRGGIDASEKNLTHCRVLWVDLDEGDRDEQLAKLRTFPVRPTLIVDSGGGYHGIWKLDDAFDCASDPQQNAHIRRLLNGLRLALGGDPAVCDPPRVFRVAGTTNYPNGRKRAAGRSVTQSGIVESGDFSVMREDLEEYEVEPEQAAPPLPTRVDGMELPPAIEAVFRRATKLRELFYCERRLASKDASAEDFAIASGIIQRAPWTADDLVVEALRFRRLALAHLVQGSRKTASYFETTVKKARRTAMESTEPPDFMRAPALWFQHQLWRAWEPQAKPMLATDFSAAPEPPRVSSSIDELDELTGGGLYGFTALAGDSGVGKSVVAQNAAHAARQKGWDVLYIAAEMEASDYKARAGRYFGVPPEEVFDDDMPTLFLVSDGLELDALLDITLSVPTDATPHYLLVIDSITKVASYVDRDSSGNSFFDAMARIVRLCEGAVRNGERRITVVATSELNREGAALGRRITYASSLQVNMMADKDQPDLVNISIPKARYSVKSGAFGPFMHDWRRSRLVEIGSLREDTTGSRCPKGSER